MQPPGLVERVVQAKNHLLMIEFGELELLRKQVYPVLPGNG